VTSLLRPAYSLTVGTQRWTEQLLELDIRLEAAPMLDVVSIRMPARAPVSAGVGDAVALAVDGGEGSVDVFTGKVDSIRHELDGIRIAAMNGGADLARYRPAVTYEKVTVATVIGNLCGDVNVDVADLETGPVLAFFAADPSRSALDHVARVAAWAGALARMSADNRLQATVLNATSPGIALRYGREITATRQGRAASWLDAVVIAGEGGAGDASDPAALRPTTDFFAGNRPAGPSSRALWLFEPALRTPAAARTAGAALERRYRSSRIRAGLRTYLLPALRPGAVVQIQGLPDGLDGGPFWVDRVHHRLSRQGAVSEARLWGGGDTFEPSSLLGSLAGALAGAI